MKKAVITAYDVSMARKAGQTGIAVPGGALVTPQAVDDARDYGIALIRGGQAPASVSVPAPAQPLATQPGPDVTEEVRRQVLARLGNTAPASLDAVIASVVTGAPGSSSGLASGSSPGFSSGGAAEVPFIRKAGSVSLVVSSALPASGSAGSGPAAVSMTEALPPGAAHPGIAYMAWENASFEWTFRHDEVLVVLEGEITLTSGSAALNGKPGDSLFIPAGSAVTLSARSRARCMHCSWPNPATAKG